MDDVKDLTEEQMRDVKVPRHNSLKELTEYIQALCKRQHDYGTCVYAMSLASVATFNYVASCLGTTGFQAGCADLDILRRTRRLEGPFAIIYGDNMLYPQYDIPAKVQEMLDEWKPWAAEEAAKKLDGDTTHAHPNVIAHWKKLAK